MPTKAPQHTSLAAALAAAQGEMGNAHKNAKNPHFRSSYADLASLRDAVIPVLSRHGIALVQLADGDGSSVTVTTRIMGHGESMDCGSLTIPVGGAKNIAQAMGSAITYARRYQIGAVAGVASTVDDDGNALDGLRPQPAPARRSPAQEVRGLLKSKIGCTSKEDAEAVIRLVSDGSLGADAIDGQPDTVLGLIDRALDRFGGYAEILNSARKE
mgnify:FL=1|tara:strand:- start:797 stop:1438 length:642 start_codon:yes stop_codon:yes gene_type:complete